MNQEKKLSSDLMASVVVFLVALPLSLGISLASSAPPQAGLIAAAVGGIVVGFLGGAPLQVSGPAAGLTVMVYHLVEKFGFQNTLIITTLAGVFQIVMGLLRASNLALMISPSVIHAMLAGIGVLITLGQTHVLLGFKPAGNAIDNILLIPSHVADANVAAVGLGVASFLIVYFWPKYAPKKIQVIPGSLVAVVLLSASAMFFHLNVTRIVVDSNLLSQIHVPHIDWTQLMTFIVPALGLMLIASAESLFCAIATDKLHTGPRAHLNKELVAQGLANTCSGLLGGLPITGVIVRSSANIAAGAQSRISAIFHGVWILFFSVFASSLLRQIPLSVLSGLLIYVGIKLVKIHEYRVLSQFKEGMIYLLTLAGVVGIGLLQGIGIGLVLSILLMLYKQSRIHCLVKEKNEVIDVDISGALSFVSVPTLLNHLMSLAPKKKVNLRFHVQSLDFAVVDAVSSFVQSYERAGGEVNMEDLLSLWKKVSLPAGA